MKPSLFYTSTTQTSDDDYVYFKGYNSSYGINSPLRHSLALVLPVNLIESEIISSIFTPLVDDFDYFEENLAGARERWLREDSNEGIKEFYRNHSNDLETGAPDTIFEYDTSAGDYLELLYDYQDNSYKIHILLPIKEGIFNYYIDDVLADPTPISYRLTTTLDTNIRALPVLQPDDTVVTQDYDTGVLNNSYYRDNDLADVVLIDDLPPANITANLYVSGSIISSTTNTISLEYLPYIKFNQSGLNLNRLDTSLYYLKVSRPDDWIILLDSIVTKLLDFIQEGYYIPPSFIYYDDNLNEFPQEYSYFDLASLVITLFNLYEDQLTSSASKFIEEATLKLASSVNVFTGFCNKTVSINLVPLVTDDFSTTILVAQVFGKFLNYRYNSTIEYLLGIITKAITTALENPLQLDQDAPLLSVDKLDLYYHLTLWAKLNNDTDTLNYVANRIGLILNAATDTTALTLQTIYTLNLLDAEGVLPGAIDLGLWEYVLFISEDSDGSWTAGSGPSSFLTAWAYILENSVPLWAEGDVYKPNIEKAESLLFTFYRRSLGFLPVGEPWFSKESLNPTVGAVGAVMKGMNTTLFPLCYQLACLYESLNLDNAYGVGLDRWGNLFSLPRFGLNETDTLYRQRLKDYTLLENLSFNKVSAFINAITKEPNTTLNTFLPTTIVVDNLDYDYVDFEDLLDKAVDNIVNLPDGTTFDLVNDVGVVKITSFESEEINNMLLILDSLFGLPVLLRNSQSYIFEPEVNRVFF